LCASKCAPGAGVLLFRTTNHAHNSISTGERIYGLRYQSSFHGPGWYPQLPRVSDWPTLQHAVEAQEWLLAAAEVGLFSEQPQRFPPQAECVRASLLLLKRHNFTIRFPLEPEVRWALLSRSPINCLPMATGEHFGPIGSRVSASGRFEVQPSLAR
jgi:hypothetical protein